MGESTSAWGDWIQGCSRCFTRPSWTLFLDLTRAWILCPGRRTVTHMICILQQARPHDAYHRLLRAGAWSMAPLWKIAAQSLVAAAVPGRLDLDIDDTLFHRPGRKVEGAGLFRDAVRTSGSGIVYARGLSLVVLTLRIIPPWGGEPLGLPINMRLHRKKGETYLDLAQAMRAEIAAWFPQRSIRLCGDGNYAPLVAFDPATMVVTSRMRRDAAIFDFPKQLKKALRGRPSKKGRRLPTPDRIAQQSGTTWKKVQFDSRGKKRVYLLYSRLVVWHHVCRDRPVLLVIARDPKGHRPDEFLVSNDLESTPEAIVSQYTGRWSIEDTFRNVKQFLGGEDPQTWRKQGPERAAALSFWLYSEIWLWYLKTHGAKITWRSLPWYSSKSTPSFLDALAALRRILWAESIYDKSAPQQIFPINIHPMLDALARAA